MPWEYVPGEPLSFVRGISFSIVPLWMIFWSQPNFIFGVFGLPSSWFDVLFMDLNIGTLLREWKFLQVLLTLLAFVRPTYPGKAPKWLRELFPLVTWFIFSDDTSVSHNSSCSSPEMYAWFYVNGICTTLRMALDTGKELGSMFHRDITVVHNPTDSMFVDILECTIGNLWVGSKNVSRLIEPVQITLKKVEKALTDPSITKVVLLSHSQGTIIASDVLFRLWEDVESKKKELTKDMMGKLEMYSFANCGHVLRQERVGPSGDLVPYIESIGNQKDNVATLGMLAPQNAVDQWKVEISGKTILPHKTRWGHMINAH
ncbi:unnamed protein product [Discosporangium mesarthrocarpum]